MESIQLYLLGGEGIEYANQSLIPPEVSLQKEASEAPTRMDLCRRWNQGSHLFAATTYWVNSYKVK